jgi:hypothetical protein
MPPPVFPRRSRSAGRTRDHRPLGWTLPDKERPAGRLPKHNPERRKTSAISDWAHVCRTASMRLAEEGAPESAAWAETAATKTNPTKSDQDQLDVCICLVSALHLAKDRDALFVGCCANGCIVVPDSEMLRKELGRRCVEFRRETTPDSTYGVANVCRFSQYASVAWGYCTSLCRAMTVSVAPARLRLAAAGMNS